MDPDPKSRFNNSIIHNNIYKQLHREGNQNHKATTVNNNSTNQESHQEEPDSSDQIVQPSPSSDLSSGVAMIGGAPPASTI